MSKLQNAIHAWPTQRHLPSKCFFNAPFLNPAFDVLKDVISERTKANLLEDILHQLLDLVPSNKMVPNIADLAITRMVCLLHKWVVGGYIDSHVTH
jgi:hypothetical protein